GGIAPRHQPTAKRTRARTDAIRSGTGQEGASIPCRMTLRRTQKRSGNSAVLITLNWSSDPPSALAFCSPRPPDQSKRGGVKRDLLRFALNVANELDFFRRTRFCHLETGMELSRVQPLPLHSESLGGVSHDSGRNCTGRIAGDLNLTSDKVSPGWESHPAAYRKVERVTRH